MAGENLILDALRQPVSAAFYETVVQLRRRWPDRAVIGVEDIPFHPGGFADGNGLKQEVVEDVPQELVFGSRWEAGSAVTYLNSWMRVAICRSSMRASWLVNTPPRPVSMRAIASQNGVQPGS